MYVLFSLFVFVLLRYGFSVASLPVIRNKQLTPTWITTTINSQYTVINAYINLVKRFNWTTFTFVADLDSNFYFADTANQLQKRLMNYVGVQTYFIPFHSKSPDYIDILKQFNSSSRGKLLE